MQRGNMWGIREYLKMAVGAVFEPFRSRSSFWTFTGAEIFTSDAQTVLNRVHPGHGKSWNLGRPYSRPGKSWKIAMVMESHGK